MIRFQFLDSEIFDGWGFRQHLFSKNIQPDLIGLDFQASFFDWLVSASCIFLMNPHIYLKPKQSFLASLPHPYEWAALQIIYNHLGSLGENLSKIDLK